MNIQKNKNKINVKTLGISIIVLIALIAVALLVYNFTQNPSVNSNADQGNRQTINYDPPTDQEVKDSQNAKKNPNVHENSTADSESVNESHDTENKQRVEVGISYAGIYEGSLEVRAFTNSVIEGGNCSVIVSNGTSQISRTSKAFIDASSTQCEVIKIPQQELPSDKLTVEVEFTSERAYGKSEKVEVN